MKKLIFAGVLFLTLLSCRNTEIKEFTYGKYTIRYFRDCRTGVCFAELAGGTSHVTCVPCDSVTHHLIPCDSEKELSGEKRFGE